jgi:outer membrane immunogenic protein
LVFDCRSKGLIMKKFATVAAAIAALGFVNAASAADMPMKAVKAPIVASAYNWSGLYGGADVGWIHEKINWAYTNPGPPTLAPFSQTNDDGTVGGFLGYQYQIGSIVVGVEGGVSSSFNSRFGSTVGGTATGPCVTNGATTCQTKMGAIWTAGGRLGYAWNNWLVYGEGGWASAQLSTQLVNSGAAFDPTSAKQNGWYAGAGVDYLLLKGSLVDTIIGAEYEHVDLRTVQHLSSLDGFNPAGANARNMSGTADIVRVRLTFKWNPWP